MDPVHIRVETDAEVRQRFVNIEWIRAHAIECFSERTNSMCERNKFARELDKEYRERGFYDRYRAIYSYCDSLSNPYGEYKDSLYISASTSKKSSSVTSPNQYSKHVESDDSIQGMWIMDSIELEK